MPTIKSMDSVINEAMMEGQSQITAIRRVVEDFIKNINPTIVDVDIDNSLITYTPNDKSDIIFRFDKENKNVTSISIYTHEIQMEIDGAEDLRNMLDPGNLYDTLTDKVKKLQLGNI